MNILVYGVAAEDGGGASVIKEFYEACVHSACQQVHWVFVLGTLQLKDTEHITALRYPDIKKSYLHRLYFETVTVRKIIREQKIDRVVSLQNSKLLFCPKPQIISLHNMLPFYKCDRTVLSGWKTRLKQFFLNQLIRYSLKTAALVLVPSEWIKEKCISRLSIDEKRIHVIPVMIDRRPIIKCRSFENGVNQRFFYPAGGQPYKRHWDIIHACEMLRAEGYQNYSVAFTLSGQETAYSAEILKYVKAHTLPIELVGFLTRQQVYERIADSVMLYPSVIETDALPIMEARCAGSFIISARTPFAEDDLKNYPNCVMCEPKNARDFYQAMKNMIDGKYQLQDTSEEPFQKNAARVNRADICAKAVM